MFSFSQNPIRRLSLEVGIPPVICTPYPCRHPVRFTSTHGVSHACIQIVSYRLANRFQNLSTHSCAGRCTQRPCCTDCVFSYDLGGCRCGQMAALPVGSSIYNTDTGPAVSQPTPPRKIHRTHTRYIYIRPALTGIYVVVNTPYSLAAHGMPVLDSLRDSPRSASLCKIRRRIYRVCVSYTEGCSAPCCVQRAFLQ